MLALRKKSAASFASISKQPGVIAGVAIAAIAITFGVTKMIRRTIGDERSQSSSLASESRSSAHRQNLSAPVSPELRKSLEARINSPNQEPETSRPNADSSSVNTSSDSSIHSHPPVDATAAAKSASASAKDPNTGPATNDGLLVAFAWTEVTHDWLQAMGAADAGLHRVAGLEERLRASTGAYRILEVSKQKITSETTSFTLQSADHGGNRTGLKVDISSLNEGGLTGSIQLSYRGNDGSMRAPAAAAMALENGQGSIMTFAPTAPPPGVSPTGNEIVVLILPRWVTDRNP
jgi:hypothetical protein